MMAQMMVRPTDTLVAEDSTTQWSYGEFAVVAVLVEPDGQLCSHPVHRRWRRQPLRHGQCDYAVASQDDALVFQLGCAASRGP